MAYTPAEFKASLERYSKRIRKLLPNIVNGPEVPIPEFVDRIPNRTWKVTRANALESNTNSSKALITVPFGDTKLSRSARVEELLHARHSTSPKTKAAAAKIHATTARYNLIQGAEDYRIKNLADMRGFGRDKQWRQGEKQFVKMSMRAILSTPPNPSKTMMGGGCPFPLEDMAYLALAAGHISSYRPVDSIGTQYGYVHELPEATTRELNSFIWEVYSAMSSEQRGVAYRRRHEHTPGKYNPYTVKLAAAVEKVLRKYESSLKAEYANPEATKVPPSDKKERQERLENHPDESGDTAEERRFNKACGTMDVHLPPLHRRLLFSIKSKTSAAIGPILHRIENLTIDAMVPPVFGVRDVKTKKPPVVLLDASGSMGINAHNVEELIKIAPGAIVYFYTGDDYSGGDLVRVSAAGRFCERSRFEELSKQGGNSVDYQALRYCLKHHAGHNLHWVTDKMYTWPKFRSDYAINAALTKYALAKGVIYHEHIREFGAYWKKKRGMI